MGLQLLLIKRISLLILLISASLLSTSFAGRRLSKSVNKLAEGVDATYKIASLRRNVGWSIIAWEKASSEGQEEELSAVHERLLKVNTKDYGRYDPSPTFVRPPFKLIPN